MVKALDCGIVVSEFELQSIYYVQFSTNTIGKIMYPIICCIAMIQLYVYMQI